MDILPIPPEVFFRQLRLTHRSLLHHVQFASHGQLTNYISWADLSEFESDVGAWLASCFYHLRVFNVVITLSADSCGTSRLHTAVPPHKFHIGVKRVREALLMCRSRFLHLEKLKKGLHKSHSTHQCFMFQQAWYVTKWCALCERQPKKVLTLKNSFVEPESRVPYAISVCFARSSALSIGETILSTVKKAARLAV